MCDKELREGNAGQVRASAVRGSVSVSDRRCALWEGARTGRDCSQAVRIAIGINWEGYRQVLAVELVTAKASRAGKSSFWHYRIVACQASSSSPRTTTRGWRRRSVRCWPKLVFQPRFIRFTV